MLLFYYADPIAQNLTKDIKKDLRLLTVTFTKPSGINREKVAWFTDAPRTPVIITIDWNRTGKNENVNFFSNEH